MSKYEEYYNDLHLNRTTLDFINTMYVTMREYHQAFNEELRDDDIDDMFDDILNIIESVQLNKNINIQRLKDDFNGVGGVIGFTGNQKEDIEFIELPVCKNDYSIEDGKLYIKAQLLKDMIETE